MIKVGAELTSQSWIRIWRTIGIAALPAIIASVGLTQAIMATMGAKMGAQGLFVSIIMPILLGGPMLFYMSLRNEQLRALNLRLNQMATTDWLTKCLNRGSFTQQVTAQLARTPHHAEASGGALLILDVDAFKAVNDRFGHPQGDAALKLVAQAICGAVRPQDLVGRLGGEEFGIYLDDASPATADHLAEEVRRAVANVAFYPDGRRCSLSISIGGATFLGPATYEKLFRLADQRLYAAKQRGRDCVAMMQAA